MNGPHHYREAEKRLSWAAENPESEWAMVNAAIGQAHATLALTAATALQAAHFEEWQAADGGPAS